MIGFICGVFIGAAISAIVIGLLHSYVDYK